MEKGLIFNIQRYSIHDGGGIRTLVFFKGCPLRCPWCSNPESLVGKPEEMLKPERCIQCSCHSPEMCQVPPEQCPTNAKVTLGIKMTVEEVLEEIEKDRLFYEVSGGGLTLSGGEPLNQWKFASDLLEQAQRRGVHTAVETSGQSSEEAFRELIRHVDTLLFDLKIMDSEEAHEVLNADMDLIKRNFQIASDQRQLRLIPRIPIIQGYTDNQHNLIAIIDFMKKCEVRECNILPFHQYGSEKYKRLKMDYVLKDQAAYNEEECSWIVALFKKNGIQCSIGGE